MICGVEGFPSREGIKGCVTVRCEIWLKEFLEVRFLGFSDCFYFKWLCSGVTHPPAPLERGDLDATFLFENEYFIVWRFPLLRGTGKPSTQNPMFQ